MNDLEPENPINMLLDALRWNMLNVIRVELFFNCYRIWNIFVKSSLQSPRGQYAVVSLLISLVAQIAAQFNLSWLLFLYSIYLLTGMVVWIYRRVWFYHRRRNSEDVNQTILSNTTRYNTIVNSTSNKHGDKYDKHDKHDKHNNGHSSTASNSSSSYSSSNENDYTNSLQRQRQTAYKDFQNVLNEPRYNHREFAVSLVHLSQTSKLVADKDTFDELHFQVLATRRDVVNMILRSLLLVASILLAYFR